MIGIDTNVLIRVIVADDARQANAARNFIRDRCTPDDPGFVSNLVLAEVAWTLAAGYGYSRQQIADAIEGIMETTQLQIESSVDASAALMEYRVGPADFADCLIGQTNRTSRCTHTVTFDRKAAKLEGFKLLSGA
jgi:predicted nucleic-acid-binding protein